MKRFHRSMYLLLALCAGSAMAGPVLTVKSKDGRSMEIELVRIFGDRVSFNRTSDAKSFELSMSAFDAESVKLINSKKAELPPAHPNYEVDVVVEKRRKAFNDSFYMKQMTVATTVKIRNPGAQPAPALSLRMLLFGEGRRTGKTHHVIGVQEYKVELAAGKSDERRLDEVTTVYDGDNKGYNNIGGAQYEGYLLLLMDEKGNILSYKTTLADLSEILKKDPAAIADYKKMPLNTMLDDKYNPAKGATRVILR